ncbi:protein PIMREG isoform X1 [Bufo bufo]|uniref:protein PIMREG isoform X1 n=1 Tax=Bufo bufo TaxID=8384 RepID=UPI001ABE7809|nr:protein PIMREG isoform X1 [Bufo bufo]XP_040277737.1 protein PIMREG isoform X1 [Bufo bufo]XP_040277738.1 protein PIMREG isoform X1 [Bufo bufo]XP_040277739.1 protein PIMREG isoform X1 [Bufo bufo]
MSSVFRSVGWRNHNVLENIDEQDSPQPDKFRKRPSSSSLNTMRMSLRKRMPLKQVEMNINAVPDWSRVGVKEKQRPLQSMTVTAKNMFGTMSKKMKKNDRKSNPFLLESPDQFRGTRKQSSTPRSSRKSTPKTPRCRRLVEEASPSNRVTPKSSKRASLCTRKISSNQWKSFSNIVGNEGLNLRRSVRAASLSSPYASPVTVSRRRQFEKDLESVSAGIRQLKRLSRVFDDAILQEERKEAILNYHSVMTKNLSRTRHSQLSWKSTRRLKRTRQGWTEVALTSIGNIGAR